MNMKWCIWLIIIVLAISLSLLMCTNINRPSGGGSGGLNCAYVSNIIVQSVTNLQNQVKEVKSTRRYNQLNKNGLIKQSEIVRNTVKNSICLSDNDKKRLLTIMDGIRRDISSINI